MLARISYIISGFVDSLFAAAGSVPYPYILVALVLVGSYLIIALGTLLFLSVAWLRHRRDELITTRFQSFIAHELDESTPQEDSVRIIKKAPFLFMEAYIRTETQIRVPDAVRERVETAVTALRFDIRLIRELSHRTVYRRCRAAVQLAYLSSPAAASALDNRLRHEGSVQVKLRIVFALVRTRCTQSIPSILDSLQGTHLTYQSQVTGLLQELAYDVAELIPVMFHRREPELQRVLIRTAESIPTPQMQRYLMHLVEHAEPELTHQALSTLIGCFADTIDPSDYLHDDDRFIVSLAVEALGRTPSEEALQTVQAHLSTPDTRKSAVLALSQMIDTSPRLVESIISALRSSSDTSVREALAEVLARKSEHVLHTAIEDDWPDIEDCIGLILKTHQATGIPAMLNRRLDSKLQRRICDVIGETVRTDSWLREEFGIYVKEEVLSQLGIEQREVQSKRAERYRENPQRTPLGLIILATVIGPFLAYLGFSVLVRSEGPWWRIFPNYLVAFEHWFIVYAFSMNVVYLILLIAAVSAVLHSTRMRRTLPLELLFKPRVAAAVSIIAPAYNEEATIVESVTALLNLRYPDYEVIVVNDGSTDETLHRLIKRFELERGSIFLHDYLKTRPVRGVYSNPLIPGLLVLDKSNGGKADSLNLGINASRKEYFAAIDADSVLESDALLRLASRQFDDETPASAVGGNVLPINGCRVELGHINEVRLPRNLLARFQMVEYIRGFMTGRTGWARIDSLLIISGAFGLFNKQDVIDVGGYMTSSERLRKDTVAEDMELVVRVARMRHDQGRPAAIRYASDANCWTEVPESRRILSSQRDRWQRGLIDVLFYHAGMTLRPRYGRTGMIAFPYHYIFELIGPWLEVQGYLFLLIGLATGVLPIPIAAAALVASVLLGVVISLLSIHLIEKQQRLFRNRDRLKLLCMATLENFGYRQFTNFLRIRANISVLRKKSGWGVMVRQGFQKGEQK